LHNTAIALLAVPILIAVYFGTLLRRSTIARASLAIGIAAIFGIGVVGAGGPAPTVATAPTRIVPLTQAAFRTTVATGHSLTDPVTITFSTPMDEASVAASLKVDPPTPVHLTWDATSTAMTIAPTTTWAVGTFHTISVQAGALATSGQPMAKAVRVVFITREPASGEIIATTRIGSRVSVATAFQIAFAGPIDTASVADAIRFDPPVDGTLAWVAASDQGTAFTFTPSAPLAPDRRYRLTVTGVRDTDGLTLEPVTLLVRTTHAPSVIRFRPRADTLDVARDAAISVRFSEAMDRTATAAAFKVTIGSKAVAGTVRWAESDRVLVFTPSAALPYGTTVAADVAGTAVSVAGVPVEAPARAIFRTVRKPAAAKPATRTPARSSGGGGAVGGGSWGAVETYYLRLMNCTRTGGWVTSSGSCSSPGGRNVAPLQLSSGISSKVSRPYAKRLAVGNDCSHFIGGNPGDRLRRAGYSSYRWAENLGCRSGNPYAAVLGSHLFFQSEKSYSGGHYVNLMNSAYDRVGIGVWVYAGRVRLVVDFYHP
jgi:uncharacterized protein YkwD